MWRNSSITINKETFKGYRKGKVGNGISEVAMGMSPFLCYAYSAVVSLHVSINTQVTLTTVLIAYDFQDSNEKRFNVLALYNSTYQNISYIPRPFGLQRVSRSLNAVSSMYFIDNNIDSSLLAVNPLSYKTHSPKITYCLTYV